VAGAAWSEGVEEEVVEGGWSCEVEGCAEMVSKKEAESGCCAWLRKLSKMFWSSSVLVKCGMGASCSSMCGVVVDGVVVDGAAVAVAVDGKA
jgi:hypothetical protein